MHRLPEAGNDWLEAPLTTCGLRAAAVACRPASSALLHAKVAIRRFKCF